MITFVLAFTLAVSVAAVVAVYGYVFTLGAGVSLLWHVVFSRSQQIIFASHLPPQPFFPSEVIAPVLSVFNQELRPHVAMTISTEVATTAWIQSLALHLRRLPYAHPWRRVRVIVVDAKMMSLLPRPQVVVQQLLARRDAGSVIICVRHAELLWQLPALHDFTAILLDPRVRVVACSAVPAPVNAPAWLTMFTMMKPPVLSPAAIKDFMEITKARMEQRAKVMIMPEVMAALPLAIDPDRAVALLDRAVAMAITGRRGPQPLTVSVTHLPKSL